MSLSNFGLALLRLHETPSDVTIVLPALFFAFAAFLIWLAVRIINRRVWAKWMLAALIVLAAYPVSFGPACWINQRTGAGGRTMARIYSPMGSLVSATSPFLHYYPYPGPDFVSHGPTRFQRTLSRLVEKYADMGTSGDFLMDWDEDDGPVWLSRL